MPKGSPERTAARKEEIISAEKGGFIMTYEEVVKEAQKIVAKGDASGIKDHLAVQYNITGSVSRSFGI